jgi:type IV pilus assembly protein PilM
MALLFPRKTHAVLGLDISTTAVKILELRRINKQFWVQGFVAVPLRPNAIVDNQIKNPQSVITAIKTALEQAHFSTRHVGIALPAAAVISKTVIIDTDLSEEELEAHVQLEAATAIPFPLDEVCMDFSVLGVNEKDSTKVDVLLVAARLAQVEARRNVVESAGLVVDCIEVESFAVERCVHYLRYKDDRKTIAVIDLGKSTMILTVIHQRQVIYTHEELLGSQPVTESLMPLLRRAMQMFLSSAQSHPVDEILLSGSNIDELAAIVADDLSLLVTIINPFHTMLLTDTVNALQLQQEASAFTIACGLALRGLMHYDRH